MFMFDVEDVKTRGIAVKSTWASAADRPRHICALF